MANPTTAKQSLTTYFPAAVTTASTVGELAVVDLPFNTQLYRDTVGNLLCRPYVGSGGGGMGYPPTLNATGFTAGGVSDQPCVKFGAGSTALIVDGRGWTGTPPNNRTIWAVIRVRMGSLPNLRTIGIWGSGADAFFHGIGITVSTAGVITVGTVVASSQFTSSTFTLTRDKWYLVAITFVNSTSRLIQIYNFTDQAFVTTEATGSTFTGAAVSNTTFPDAVLNPYIGYDSYDKVGFIGDVYACGLSTATFDPATNAYFAALVANPTVVSGGTYSGGGGLTANGVINNSTNKTSITIHSNRPTGGTPASYQFRLHRSTTSGFTAGAGTILGSLQSSPILTDSTALAGTTYYYKVEQYDGTTTVYSSTASSSNYTQVAGRLPVDDFFFLVIGDSRWGTDAGSYLARALRSMGYRSGVINMGLAGSRITHATASASWQPNTTQDPTNGQASTVLLANAMTAATDAANCGYAFSALGINDANAGNTAATITTKYGFILNITGAAGYKTVILKPWETGTINSTVEAGMLLLVGGYYPALDALANGTTIFTIGATTLLMDALGIGEISRDNLHLVLSNMDAIAAAKDVNQMLGHGGGGGSVIGSPIVRAA